MKIASEEDLLTLDASTGKKTYRHFTPEDYRLFETETILMREEAQRTIDEINCHIGNRRIAFKCVFHVAQILSASLDEYRQLVKVAKTEHSHPLGMVVSTHFRCGKGVKRGLKNGALPFTID